MGFFDIPVHSSCLLFVFFVSSWFNIVCFTFASLLTERLTHDHRATLNEANEKTNRHYVVLY